MPIFLSVNSISSLASGLFPSVLRLLTAEMRSPISDYVSQSVVLLNFKHFFNLFYTLLYKFYLSLSKLSRSLGVSGCTDLLPAREISSSALMLALDMLRLEVSDRLSRQLTVLADVFGLLALSKGTLGVRLLRYFCFKPWYWVLYSVFNRFLTKYLT